MVPLVGVLGVGHVALCAYGGGDAVLVLGDGHDTISSKAGDGAAPDNDVDLFRVIARNFDAFSHDELRSFLTRSGWPAVRP